MSEASSYYFSEASVESAQPVLLAHFAAGDTHWRYTTAPYDVLYGGDTYTHEPGLGVGEIEVTNQQMRSTLEIEVDWSNDLLQQLWTNPPDVPISVTILRGHTDQDHFYQVFGLGIFGAGIFGGHAFYEHYWDGWLQQHGIRDRRRAVLICTPSIQNLGAASECLRWGRLCQVPLYSPACGVVKASYAAGGTVLTVDGVDLTAAVFGLQADGYYDGGLFESALGNRMILVHTTTAVELSHVVTGLVAGTAFACYPGCDHLWPGHCKTRFGNLLNHRGAPYIPTRDPHVSGLL
jgi:hypothetical protein